MSNQKGNSHSDWTVGEDHFFMKRLDSPEAGRFVRIDFKAMKESSSSAQLKVIPLFNQWPQSYLPTFTLPLDQKSYMEQKQMFLELHKKKIQQATEEKRHIFVPKPSTKNKCCCVCRCLYEDYLQHVTGPNHSKMLQACEFSKDIAQLCQKFNPAPKRNSDQRSTDYQVKQQQKPRKKRKVETPKPSVKLLRNNSESGCFNSLPTNGLTPQLNNLRQRKVQTIV